jgi:hypothetical protein
MSDEDDRETIETVDDAIVDAFLDSAPDARLQRIEAAVAQLNAQLHALRHPTLLPPPPPHFWGRLDACARQLQRAAADTVATLNILTSSTSCYAHELDVLIDEIAAARGCYDDDVAAASERATATATDTDDEPPTGAA